MKKKHLTEEAWAFLEFSVLLQQEETSGCLFTSCRTSDRFIPSHLGHLLWVAVSGKVEALRLWCWALACAWAVWPELDTIPWPLAEVGWGRPPVLRERYCQSSASSVQAPGWLAAASRKKRVRQRRKWRNCRFNCCCCVELDSFYIATRKESGVGERFIQEDSLTGRKHKVHYHA